VDEFSTGYVFEIPLLDEAWFIGLRPNHKAGVDVDTDGW
jgi:hypothetical protein